MKNEKRKNQLKYTLQITERQLNIIREALDLYHRLLDGHIENELWGLFSRRDIDHEEFSVVCRRLKEIIFPELAWNAYYGVGWKENDRRQQASQIGYEIEAMIRHELWKRDPDAPRYVTSASEPLHYSTEEFVKLEELENERR